MKRIASASVILSLLTAIAQAEPVFMPQAGSVLKQKQAEVGVDGNFGYQSSEIVGSPGTTFKNRVWQIPLYARYGILDNLESHLTLPIVRAVDSSEGVSSTRNASTGFGNIQLGAKYTCPKTNLFAAAVDFDLPTANSKNNAGALGQRYSGQIQQGFNAHLRLLADTPEMADLVSGHVSVGYMNAGKYTTSSDTKFDPSDLMTFGASVDLKLHRWVNNLSASAEMIGNTALNHSKTDGVQNGNDKGTVIEVGPALRYQMGRVKTHVGVLFDDGKAAFRAYNYQVNFGLSLLFDAR